jgi:urease accessory protein
MDMAKHKLLNLMQLISPSLPLGGFNYSESLELLDELVVIPDLPRFQHWLTTELLGGSIRFDVALILRARMAIAADDLSQLKYWNSWLNGTRETKELRQQSVQMGNTLLKLLGDLDAENKPQVDQFRAILGKDCHYAIAFGIAVALWDIDPQDAVLGYLHSWVTNLVGAGVKLIPLGQTAGQQIIHNLHPVIEAVAEELMQEKEDHLYACSWGLSLASMNHETMYSRLFRS